MRCSAKTIEIRITFRRNYFQSFEIFHILQYFESPSNVDRTLTYRGNSLFLGMKFCNCSDFSMDSERSESLKDSSNWTSATEVILPCPVASTAEVLVDPLGSVSVDNLLFSNTSDCVKEHSSGYNDCWEKIEFCLSYETDSFWWSNNEKVDEYWERT